MPPANRPISAQTFRRWVLRPAEGVFLFHPRAIERLHGLDPPRAALEVCYHLMARQRFLAGLEDENPEALSVIEGLVLPEWVLLLPMPGAPTLRATPQRTLLRDYWARRSEGEIARTWQTARENNQDLGRFGPAALADLIGGAALAEAMDVLARDGVPDALAGPAELCRAFVARAVRLRYFAPGTRGCSFPAVRDWAAVDRWLDASGLHLPSPRPGGQLPQAMERSRPGAPCGHPTLRLPLPADLPCGRSDPDRAPRTVGAANTRGALPRPAVRLGLADSGPGPERKATAVTGFQARCLLALREGAAVRRRPGRAARLAAALADRVQPLAGALLDLWDRLAGTLAAAGRPLPGRHALIAGLAELRAAAAAAQRADWDGHFGAALGHLADAEARYAALRARHAHPPGSAAPEPASDPVADPVADPVETLLAQRRGATAENFASVLAATWHLPPTAADDLGELLCRLAAATGPGARPARKILVLLDSTLTEGRTAYYRLEPRALFTPAGPRRILPFIGPLKALAALDGARRLVDDLPWPLPDLERLGALLALLGERMGGGLTEHLKARLREALDAAGMSGTDAPGQRAAERLIDALAGLIRRHRHLRFSDVRDLVNQDALSLPDATWSDWRQGDRLGRFDRAAAGALPGVYQPGEFYVKGLQRLSAPLFGTPRGRWALRLVLLPGLGAWAILKTADLLWGLLDPDAGPPELTHPAAVLAFAAAISLTANTVRGRLIARVLWHGLCALLRLLFLTGLPRLLRSAPVRWLWERRLVRGLVERVLAPTALGALPLLPVAGLWLLADPHDPGPAAWVAMAALAYAVGTLLRDTPAGRRRLDDLTTGWRQFRDLLRQERLADLIAPVIEFFRRGVRVLTENLHRIRTRLSPRLGEDPAATLLKGLAAPFWTGAESVLRFYVVVLVEPQTNPIKHFPVVTLGHKLLLPLLPTLSIWLNQLLSPLLPAALRLPLIGVTLFLLPGFFGFLFWEFKENWRLYAANRADAVPPVRLGTHGETLNGLLHRGLHGGTLPKAFDRLRRTLAQQVRDEAPDPRALRRAVRRLTEVTAPVARFGEQELAVPLRAILATPSGAAIGTPIGTGIGTGGAVAIGAVGGTLADRPRVQLDPPRIATHQIEFRVRCERPGSAAPLMLFLELTLGGSIQWPATGTPVARRVTCTLRREGPWEDLTRDQQRRIAALTETFAHRCGAAAPESPRSGTPAAARASLPERNPPRLRA